MNLYLATFQLRTYVYMGNSTTSDTQYRLVMGESVKDAEHRLEVALTRDDPYGTSVLPVDIEITEPIV